MKNTTQTSPYALFLDDLREPESTWLDDEKNSLILESGVSNWVIARDYNQFEFILHSRGIPAMVSFDHDLHREHAREYLLNSVRTGYINYEIFNHKTGKDCAKLIMNAVRAGSNKPKWYVHSSNHIGREEIKKIMNA